MYDTNTQRYPEIRQSKINYVDKLVQLTPLRTNVEGFITKKKPELSKEGREVRTFLRLGSSQTSARIIARSLPGPGWAESRDLGAHNYSYQLSLLSQST